MKASKYFFIIISILLLSSCALNQNYRVKRDISKINKSYRQKCFVGIDIHNLSKNKKIFSDQSEHLFTPASTLKLFTSYIALKQEGTDFRFHTQLFYDGCVTDSILYGDLHIKASGDPTLASSFCNKQETEHFSQWERIIRNSGIKFIQGNLCIIKDQDISPKYQPGWQIDDIGTNYQSMISEFIYQDNRLAFRIKSDSSRIVVETDSTYLLIQIVNKIQPATNTRIRIMQNDTGEFILNGNILPQDEKTIYASIKEPEAYFLNSFSHYLYQNAYLEEEKDIRYLNSKSLAPDSLHLIYDFVSMPLDSICFYINNYSVNSYAEQVNQFVIDPVFKADELTRIGIDLKTRSIVDGSGLSIYNKLSPSDFTHLLQSIYQDSLFTTFINTLSIGGERGTLSQRIDPSSVKSKVYGKSGSMSSISNAVCFVKGNNGEWYSVVLMMNNIPKGYDVSRYLQEICIILEKHLIKH